MGASLKNKGLERFLLIARLILTFIVMTIISFAVISGSQDYGGGIQGILKNSPNALPWIPLLLGLVLAWKSAYWGGILFTILGVAALLVFTTGPVFFPITFAVLLSIPMLGIGLIVAGRLEKSKQ